MENKQERGTKTPGKRKQNGDLSQLDLWGMPAPAPAVSPPVMTAKNTSQSIEPKQNIAEVRALPSFAAAKPAAVQVTVSRARPHANAAIRSPGRTVNQDDRIDSFNGELPALTRRQHELLDYLRRRAEHGQHPASLTEICRDLGLASRGSLHKQVMTLVAARLVEPMNGKQRGVRLVQAANDSERLVPLLGAIAAGRPIEAVFQNESLALPAWLKTAANCYALRVRGDSMRDAGILDGDVVVIESRNTARNGETVVALINGEEATLKRIEQRADEVILHAENPLHAAQRYSPDQVQIQGVVVAQLRKY